MGVDTCKNVKQVYSNLAIIWPFLEVEGYTTPKKIIELFGNCGKYSKTGEISINNILEESFEHLNNPKSTGRFRKYSLQNKLLIEELNNGILENTIPIIFSGLTVTEEGRVQGVDPYSIENRTTNEILKALKPSTGIHKLRLIYDSPFGFISRLSVENNTLGIEDILMDRIETEINPNFKTGFGSLRKELNKNIIPSATYNKELLDSKQITNSIRKTPGLFETIQFEKVNEFIHKKEYEAFINKKLLGFKLAYIMKFIDPSLLRDLNMAKVPLYMEKSSKTFTIVNYAKKYLEKENIIVPTQFVGDGIMPNEQMPIGGTSNAHAIRKLVGLINATTKENLYLKTSKPKHKIEYYSDQDFPFILIEQNITDKPAISDLFRELPNEQKKYVEQFCRKFNVGVSRVEPLITSLMLGNCTVYDGPKNMSKKESLWEYEIKNKKLIWPHQLGLLDFINDDKGDLRGSELSLNVNVRFDKNYDPEKPGCSMEKVIGTMDRTERNKLILEELKRYPDPKRPTIEHDYWQWHDKNQNPIAAIRGTGIHELFNAPIKGHLSTFELAGIEPVTSDNYAEHSFSLDLDFGKITWHPDAYFMLERPDGKYDIVMIDVKSNRITPYPEHKYMNQTLGYSWFTEQLMNKKGLEVENYYTFLIKMSFYRGFKDEIIISNETTFRPQRFTKGIKFTPDSPYRQGIPIMLETIINEKKSLKDHNFFINYKSRMEKEKKCEKCPVSNLLICDYLAREGF